MTKLKSINYKWAELIVVLLHIAAMFAVSAITKNSDITQTRLWGTGIYGGYESLPGWQNNYTWGVFIVPSLLLGIYVLSLLLPKLDPRRKNYDKFRGTYLMVKWLIIAFLTVNHWMSIAWVWGADINRNMVNFILIGAIAMFMGNFMSKLRSNWFIGILTPFTLSSEESWIKTHRIGGRLLFIWGLALLIVAPFFNGFTRTMAIYSLVFTAYALAAAIGLVIYSYLVWRKDPNARIVIIRRAWRGSDHEAVCEGSESEASPDRELP